MCYRGNRFADKFCNFRQIVYLFIQSSMFKLKLNFCLKNNSRTKTENVKKRRRSESKRKLKLKTNNREKESSKDNKMWRKAHADDDEEWSEDENNKMTKKVVKNVEQKSERKKKWLNICRNDRSDKICITISSSFSQATPIFSSEY